MATPINYNGAQPSTELILALANCLSQSARTQAYHWIEEQREYFLEDSNFIAVLVISQQSETRAFARRLLASSILSDRTARVLIGRIIAQLLAFTPEGEGELAKEIGETLLLSFTPQLRTLRLGIINDLLAHPLLEIQELGARILLNHEITAENLPPQIIESLLASPYESLRVIGIRLFGQLPDEKLIGEERILIVVIAVNAREEIRNAIKPIIHRLGTAHPAFAIALASDFIEVLLTDEQHEGVHSYLVLLLRELQGWMLSINKETTFKLLQAKSSSDMQLFTTNYLENYTVDNPERLRELMPYFVTVLSSINRSRVAKQRIFAFLNAEAQKSEEAARVVAEIMTRQSVTMAIGDKAAAIQIMLKIHKNYPHLSLPIQVKTVVEVRS